MLCFVLGICLEEEQKRVAKVHLVSNAVSLSAVLWGVQ